MSPLQHYHVINSFSNLNRMKMSISCGLNLTCQMVFNSDAQRMRFLDDHRPCGNLGTTVFLSKFFVIAVLIYQPKFLSSREKFKITCALQLNGIFIIKIIQDQLKVNSVKVLGKICNKVNLTLKPAQVCSI